MRSLPTSDEREPALSVCAQDANTLIVQFWVARIVQLPANLFRGHMHFVFTGETLAKCIAFWRVEFLRRAGPQVHEFQSLGMYGSEMHHIFSQHDLIRCNLVSAESVEYFH